MGQFRGLGFNLYEGYGMTESAPVLTVTRPGQKLVLGSVGEALSGIAVKIHEPDQNGVGEIIASGPNVMLGYYNDPQATAETIKTASCTPATWAASTTRATSLSSDARRK